MLNNKHLIQQDLPIYQINQDSKKRKEENFRNNCNKWFTFNWVIPARTTANGGGYGNFNINSATEQFVHANNFACMIFSYKIQFNK